MCQESRGVEEGLCACARCDVISCLCMTSIVTPICLLSGLLNRTICCNMWSFTLGYLIVFNRQIGVAMRSHTNSGSSNGLFMFMFEVS